MKWRLWSSAAALLFALAACGGETTGETIVQPLECGDGTVVCGQSCIDIGSDPRHCGACDDACATGEICMAGVCEIPCPDGQELCDGICVDLAADERHCGSCGSSCAASEACIEGACEGSCPSGQEFCDGSCVELGSDRLHCGACGFACAAGEACVGGSCSATCPPSQENCDGSCISLATSDLHCGACGNACGEGEVCSESECVSNCPAGQADCGGGCFDLDTSVQHCGACGVACEAGEICSAGTCATSCGGGLTDCDGRCVDTEGDRSNCGACGTVCSTDELCIDGACDLVCAPGTLACDGSCVDTDTNAAHCGACGVSCAQGEMCEGGSCIPACNPFATELCGGVCTNTQVDRMNCGSCGNSCGAGFVCNDGTCTAFCDEDKDNCDGSCTSTDSDPDNCGGCGNACAAASNGVAVCAAGTCGNICTEGYGDCNFDLSEAGSDGCETTLATSVAHCGGCGNACPTPANGTASCVDATCGIGSCEAGWDDCDGQAVNGCEAELATNDQHCGACGLACPATHTCEAGTCVPAPPGDSCANPIVAGVGTHTVAWTDKGYQDWITSTPSCGSSAPTGGDIVIEYQSTINGSATVSISKPTSQRWHMVVSNQPCGIVTEYACHSEFTANKLEVTFSVIQGQTYYIYVVDSTSGSAPLDNPLTFTITELDCATYTHGIKELHPAHGGVQYVADAPIAAVFSAPVIAYGDFTLTDSLNNSITIPVSDPSVTFENGGTTIVVNPSLPLVSGETYTVTWTGMESAICPGNPLAPPAWTFSVPAAAVDCTPGVTPGMVGGTVTRISTSLMGTPTEYYVAADHDPAGWVYLGGTTELFRLHKVNGIAQNVHGAAGIGSAQLGYDMAIEGANIFTLESKTSGVDGHLYRISSDGGLSWNMQDAAVFPQDPNDDLRGLTVRGGRAHMITEEFSDGTEIWSVDVSGSLPGQARLEVLFGAGVFAYCEGLDVDASYYYTTCRSKQRTSSYYQVRIDRTTGAYAVLSTGFDGNITAMSMHAADTTGDGLADFIYFSSDEAAGYAVCNPTGTQVGTAEVFDFDPGTSNYGMSWDPVLNVLWAWDDGTRELIRVD